MALPTFVAAGTVSSGGAAATLTPGLPTGHTTDDILLLVMECDETGTPTAPTGSWAAVADSPQITSGTGVPTQLNIWWKRDNGSESALSFTGPANHSTTRVYAFRGCITTGNPWDVTSGGVQNTTGTSMSVTGDTTTVADCLVVVACASGFDSATDQFSGWANSDLGSITDRGGAGTAVGNGGSFTVITGTKAAAGAYGATTATIANSTKQAFMSIALKPPSSGFTGTAAITAPHTTLAATGVERFIGTSAFADPHTTLAATGVERFIGTSAFADPHSTLAASGLERFIATSSFADKASVLAALGVERFIGTADFVDIATVLGALGQLSGGVVIAQDAPAFTQDLVVTVEGVAPPTEPDLGGGVFIGPGFLKQRVRVKIRQEAPAFTQSLSAEVNDDELILLLVL